MVNADARRGSGNAGGVLAALVLAMLAFSVVQTATVPIMPTLKAEFSVSATSITWMMTANLLAAAVLTPVLGRVGDIRGRRLMLVVSLAGVLAGSVLAVATHSYALLIVARVLQGAGGGVLPLAVAIVRDELPEERVTGGVALVSASMGVGTGLGLVLTGVLVGHGGYKSVFWMGLVLSAAALLAVLALVRRDPVRPGGGADPVGTLLLAGWLSALLIAVSQGNNWGWTSGRTLGLFAAAAVLAAGWAAAELRARNPLVDVRMLTHPAVAVTNAAGALIGFGMYGSFLLLSDFTQTPGAAGYGFGASVLRSGLMMLPFAVGSLAAAPLGARLIAARGPRLPMVLGGLLVAGALAALAARHGTPLDVCLAAGVQGVGIGLAYAAMPAYINGAVAAGDSGVANGVNAVLRTVGGAVGTATAGAILTASLRPVTPTVSLPTVQAYQQGLLVAAALALAAALVPLAVRASRTRAASGPAPAAADAGCEPVVAGR